MTSVSSVAYCSSANLGPGYDVLAVSHDAFFDRVTVTNRPIRGEGQVRIVSGTTPQEPEKNTAGLSVLNMMHDFGIRDSVTVTIEKGIPPGLGIGSSGASSAAAVHAMNSLFDLSLDTDDMVRYAMGGEVASSGSPHADNVSASLAGGLVMVSSMCPVKVKRLSLSDKFSFLIVIPRIFIENKTMNARKMVPGEPEMEKVIQNTRYLSSLIAGLIHGDSELVRYGMNDSIVEPARSPLFPFYGDLKKIAMKNGAAGASVSGAGPSILFVCDENTNRSRIISESEGLMRSFGHDCSIVSSKPGCGAFNEAIDAYGH